MVFPRNLKLFLLTLFSFTILSPLKAQIVFRDLSGYKINLSDSTFFETNQFRKIIPLNGQWQVYKAGDAEKKKINI